MLDKIITTGGEGGMVTTNNKKLWQIMWSYKDYENHHSVFKISSAWIQMLHDSFGTNFRMTEIQASIEEVAKVLKVWNRLRNRNARIIHKVAKNFSILDVPDNPVENVRILSSYINVKRRT